MSYTFIRFQIRDLASQSKTENWANHGMLSHVAWPGKLAIVEILWNMVGQWWHVRSGMSGWRKNGGGRKNLQTLFWDPNLMKRLQSETVYFCAHAHELIPQEFNKGRSFHLSVFWKFLVEFENFGSIIVWIYCKKYITCLHGISYTNYHLNIATVPNFYQLQYATWL